MNCPCSIGGRFKWYIHKKDESKRTKQRVNNMTWLKMSISPVNGNDNMLIYPPMFDTKDADQNLEIIVSKGIHLNIFLSF